MKMEVSFKELGRSFHPGFGEINNVSDGGYERGYEQGYATGYDDGSADGAAYKNMIKTLVDRTITEIELPSDLNAIGDSAFYNCTNLELTQLPDGVTKIGINAFMNCRKINIQVMPSSLTSFGVNAFNGCYAMTSVDIKGTPSFGNSTFQNCNALTALILRGADKVCQAGTNMLVNTPIIKGIGYIYVPAALVDSYKAATNWKTYATQFRALEDYTVDGTTTGELDESKI